MRHPYAATAQLAAPGGGACPTCPPCPNGVDPRWWAAEWRAGRLGSGYAQCYPELAHARVGADGCAEEKVYCKTRGGILRTVPAAGELVIDLTTVSDHKAFIRQLVMVSASVAAVDITLTSLQRAGKEWFTNGALPFDAFIRTGDDDSNILPPDVDTTSSVPCELTLANANVAAQVIQGFYIMDEPR